MISIKKSFQILMVLVFSTLLCSKIAYADSYLIKVQQVAPRVGFTYHFICRKEECVFPFTLLSSRGKGFPIDTKIKSYSGNIIFNFRIGEKFFYLSNREAASTTHWYTGLDDNGHADFKVGLFTPTAPEGVATALHQDLVIKEVSNHIATLSITAQQIP